MPSGGDAPLFSVIVPTYGRPRFLDDALRSVQEQTITDFECIVVDDSGPTPARIADDRRFRLVRRDTNGGPGAARNTGLEHARGRYVTFLDDDDLFTTDRLELALEALARAPVAVCWSRFLEGPAGPGRMLSGDVSDVILDGLTPNLGATAVQREVAPAFDEFFRAYQDLDWWLRLAQGARVATQPSHGYLVRRHDGPRIRSQLDVRVQYNLRLLEKHDEYFRTHRRAAAFRWRRIGLIALEGDGVGVARRAFVRSMLQRPHSATAKHLVISFTRRRSRPAPTDDPPSLPAHPSSVDQR